MTRRASPAGHEVREVVECARVVAWERWHPAGTRVVAPPTIALKTTMDHGPQGRHGKEGNNQPRFLSVCSACSVVLTLLDNPWPRGRAGDYHYDYEGKGRLGQLEGWTRNTEFPRSAGGLCSVTFP